MTGRQSQSGFSLIELVIATGVLLVVSSIVTSALLQMTDSQKTVWNRTEMHSGIRGATELLQQEVGQAGRITLPGPVWVASSPVNTVPANPTACVTASPVLNSVAGMWYHPGTNTGISLTFLDGDNSETVRISGLNTAANSVTACFWKNHAAGVQGVGAPVTAMGSFANGIIPNSGVVNGSTDSVLKMFGDINGDGNMVYVEYTCDSTVSHNLYRNVMAFDAAIKPAVTASQILLGNIIDNPGLPPIDCFVYQTASMLVQGTPFTFVLDVAVTLTVETEQIDPLTRLKQTETKALLNVSPRNVFSAWMLAGMSYTDRIQSTPATVTALLP
jgi:prepilin-type N-terminal cleavage/methylation domain-containing protein